MRLIALFAMLLCSIGAFAQTDTLWISTSYTTHIIFATDVTYADLSNNKIVAPIRLDGGTVTFTTYSTTADMRQSLTGVISGSGKFKKDGIHTVYLTSPNNAWTGGTEAVSGAVFALKKPLSASPPSSSPK